MHAHVNVQRYIVNPSYSSEHSFFVHGSQHSFFCSWHLTGRIPLRQLVYRVLDLPPSMRPMVYDFGQLNVDTEKDYTRQIVSDRCRDIPLVGADMSLVNAIAHVLAWSQKYMRDRKASRVQTSFMYLKYWTVRFCTSYRMSAVLWVLGMWKEPWLCLSTFVPSFQLSSMPKLILRYM